MHIYLLTHDWSFDDGSCGHYELSFDNSKDALESFKYLQFLIENDEYNFDVNFCFNNDVDMTFSAFEDINSLVNRQDLILHQIEL